MALELKQETLELIESQMKSFGFESADELIEAALLALAEHDGEHFEVDIDELDDETRAAIDRADQQIAQGLCLPWEEVREELKGHFGMR
jgi:hypothetical protein